MVTKRIPYLIFGLMVLLNVLFIVVCDKMTTQNLSNDYATKMTAVRTALKAQAIIGARLTGPEYTPITTTLGSYEAKQLSLHPDFAAVVVDMLISAGVKAGDRVAVNMSGSFPALNIAAVSAVDAIGAIPVITSSVGASTWGATDPDYTWLDMEDTLVRAGLWQWRSQVASVGGIGDNGGGMSLDGLVLAHQAITRSGIKAIEAGTLTDAIELRLQVYHGSSGELPVALVNVGGSHVVFGEGGHRTLPRTGLTSGYLLSSAYTDGLISRFVAANRPVIHLLNISLLAARYDIHLHRPPGESRVFFKTDVSTGLRLITIGWLTTMISLLWYGRRKGWWEGPCR